MERVSYKYERLKIVGMTQKSQTTLNLEITIEGPHADILKQLEANANVEAILSTQLRPTVEQQLHDIYMSDRYNRE